MKEKNILVFGSGGREYIIIKRLYEDSILHNNNLNIICLETNENTEIKKYAKIIKKCDYFNINDFLCNLITEYKFYLAIVGSEDFLLKGVVDLLKSYNIPCMGPSKINAQLETSKSFSRNFVNNYDDLKIYNPVFNIYNCKNDFINDLDNVFNKFNEFVIKKDGLYKGKGVFVENIDFERTIKGIENLDIDNSILIIEEKFIGEEFSLMSIIDYGNNINHFPPIRDYKRLNENDTGNNTGGMGCIIDKDNCLPFLDSKDIIECQNINSKVVKYLNSYINYENHINYESYRGILYGSFIKTDNGIKIIEFNCRFGDPEIIVALSLLKNNFWELCVNYVDGSLKDLQFSQDSCICVYVVPKTYCVKNEKNDKFDIYFNDFNSIKNNIIYSNIEILDNHIYSLRSRCFAIVIKDSNLYNCYHNCYKLLKNINGNIKYRNDIGCNFLSKYEASGVCIEQSSKSLEEIKSYILSTYNKNVVSEFGSFGGEININGNILVCSIDGVGTKTLFSKNMKGTSGFINLGKDIVGHSINDILVQGANPLFFLDYFGCNNLNIYELKNFIKGVSFVCNEYGNIPILGGETAEMPLVYNNNNIDLVGCIIGIKDKRYFKNSISSGDLILNIPSNGPHTNGFTLINKLIKNCNVVDDDVYDDLINTLLEPHKCYYNEVHEFVDKFGHNNLHGMCHITGGGIHDNLKRIIKNNNYDLDKDILKKIYPDWCKKIQTLGNITDDEMYNVYNCGFGFLLIVNKNILNKLNILSFNTYVVGKVL